MLAVQVWSLGSGRPPGGGNGHPLQYPRLGHPMDRGAWPPWVLQGVGHDWVTNTDYRGGTTLAVRWLRLCDTKAVPEVQSPVGELRSCVPRATAYSKNSELMETKRGWRLSWKPCVSRSRRGNEPGSKALAESRCLGPAWADKADGWDCLRRGVCRGLPARFWLAEPSSVCVWVYLGLEVGGLALVFLECSVIRAILGRFPYRMGWGHPPGILFPVDFRRALQCLDCEFHLLCLLAVCWEGFCSRVPR